MNKLYLNSLLYLEIIDVALVVNIAVKHTPPGGTERQYTFTFKIKRQSLMESSYTVN